MMVACVLHGDRWDGRRSDDWDVIHPSPAKVEAAIRRMDAHRYTLVTLSWGGDVHMGVGGGAGRYVVYLTFDNQNFWSLVRHGGGADDRVLLIAGGQEGDFRARQVVTEAQAIAAACHFLTHRARDPQQRWERA